MDQDKNTTIKQCLIFKTHIWNADIESYVSKLLVETEQIKFDFWILLHDENGHLLHRIPECMRFNTISFTEQMIREIYDDKTFFGIHTSNHWIMMYFWKKIKSDYDYLWSMEYDVRISGSVSTILNFESTKDFVYTMGFRQNPSNRYYKFYTGTNQNRFQGYVQLIRLSSKALKIFDSEFTNGINGQDELILYTLAHEHNLSLDGSHLKSFIKGQWTWQDKSALNKAIYENCVKLDESAIFHPVKI
jgi:hypothetical protein